MTKPLMSHDEYLIMVDDWDKPYDSLWFKINEDLYEHGYMDDFGFTTAAGVKAIEYYQKKHGDEEENMSRRSTKKKSNNRKSCPQTTLLLTQVAQPYTATEDDYFEDKGVAGSDRGQPTNSAL